MRLLEKAFGDNRTCPKDSQNLTFHANRIRRRKFTAYRMLFKHIRDIILFIDSEGNILEANTAALNTYGYTREELCTLKIHDLRAELSRDLINSQIRVAYRKGITFETYHVRKNGEHFPVEVSSHQIVIGNEKVLLSVIRDIMERKRLEREIVESESINTIGQVAAGLAHEIRNSIASVHGFLQLAASQSINQTQFAANCDLMLQELDHANFVISELLSAANDKEMKLKQLNLNQIFLSLIPTMQTVAKAQNKTVEIQLEDTPAIPLDQQQFIILINHLVQNALESMPPGGKVSIRTYLTDNKLILSVKDNGVGIKPEIQDKLGTPFFTTKGTGIGLGLFICKCIAIRHNAELNIESSEQGTSVQVKFKIPPLNLKAIRSQGQ